MIRWLKWGWVALLAIIFVSFSAWYGGKGKPISAEEGAALIESLRTAYASAPQDEGFIENMIDMIPNDDGREFYAVNLEQLKTGPDAETADRAYAGMVFPLLLKRAGHPVFVSERAGLMLGTYGEAVDRVAVVRYRSLRDLIHMVREPAMIAGSADKFKSLAHTEVFITRPTITFMHVRFVFALILILIGLAGWKLIGWVERRG